MLPGDKSYGKIMPNGSWDGMLGLILKQVKVKISRSISLDPFLIFAGCRYWFGSVFCYLFSIWSCGFLCRVSRRNGHYIDPATRRGKSLTSLLEALSLAGEAEKLWKSHLKLQLIEDGYDNRFGFLWVCLW